jgi:hypothetical protein
MPTRAHVRRQGRHRARSDRQRREVRCERAGGVTPDGLVDRAPSAWGLAARGALVEPGAPPSDFDLDLRDEVWADAAPRLYAQAAAAQWDPESAVDWAASFVLPTEVEDAVVQVMTYLVENEQAALTVPARFLGRIHPHYREVVQFLAIQAADEARHLEVFTRRATLTGRPLGVSGAGGRASLQSLLSEPDFTMAHFLLSVLGEGTFLNLLAFIEQVAPDPVTRQVAGLALADERRHVAFGMAHLLHRVSVDHDLRPRLAAAIRRRHDMLADTAGLNADVYDALVILAAGDLDAGRDRPWNSRRRTAPARDGHRPAATPPQTRLWDNHPAHFWLVLAARPSRWPSAIR